MPIFAILRIFVKKENIALFIASDMYRYSGNTKYLYQYFNTHSNDKCYWITESKEVINHFALNELSLNEMKKIARYVANQKQL